MRHVGDRIGLSFLVVVPLPNVRNHADDGQPTGLIASRRLGREADRSIERVLSGKIHRRQPLVDDHTMAPRFGVGVDKARPCNGRRPIVSKYRDPMLSIVTSGRCSPGRAPFPSISNCRTAPPPNGGFVVVEAASMSLTDEKCSSSRAEEPGAIVEAGVLAGRKNHVHRSSRDVLTPISIR